MAILKLISRASHIGLLCQHMAQRLARWVEHHLQPFAQQHTSYIRDIQSFLKQLEYINETRAPLSDTTKLISWDIVNFYPNCNTKMCIEAIKRVLQTYLHIDLKVPTESIIQSWADKWEGAEGITRDWIKVHSPRPATAYGNIKTHKPG